MRICFLVNDFSARASGGIGTYVDTIARGLSGKGHQVTVLTASAKGREGAPYGIRSVTVPLGEDRSRLRVSELFADALVEMRTHMPVDLVEGTDWGVEAFHLAHNAGFRVVLRFHTPDSVVTRLNGGSMFSDSVAVQAVETKYFTSTRFLSSPSRAMSDLMATEFHVKPDRVTIIPNPIAMASFTADSGSSRRLSSPGRVCFVGRMERRKGVYDLAEALLQVFRKTPLLQVDFVGSDTRHSHGTVGRDVRKILADFPDRVHFHGFMGRESSDAVLRNCTCVVLPSLWENFPYTCLEAMARCKPVIATTGSGFEEIIENRVTGILVPPKDPGALAEAIMGLAAGTWPHLASNALRSMSRYDVDALIPQFEDFYRMVLSQ